MKQAVRILVVDDELNIRRILEASFARHGWETISASNGTEALQLLIEQEVDCVLTDVTMPGMSGYQLQNEIKEQFPDLPVVIMTAFGTIPDAVKAIRNGAREFITKPFDLDVLKKVIEAAMDKVLDARPKRTKKIGLKHTQFIAESPEMQEVLDTIRQVADSRATVLITGESGTGKEVVAKLIHEFSPRNAESFVGVSCAALPETLLESELFGYEKGAFTGAQTSKLGRFELADQGTLFLDEIGEIPLATQVKLLRVLQEREFERLGATKPTKVDVRLVTATNRDLQLAVDEGTFRLDLMYRLQVVEIQIPALRDRKSDILPLARFFLNKCSLENSRTLFEIGEEAGDALMAYHWPGNVRELENTMERAVVLAKPEDVELKILHLPKSFRLAA